MQQHTLPPKTYNSLCHVKDPTPHLHIKHTTTHIATQNTQKHTLPPKTYNNTHCHLENATSHIAT